MHNRHTRLTQDAGRESSWDEATDMCPLYSYRTTRRSIRTSQTGQDPVRPWAKPSKTLSHPTAGNTDWPLYISPDLSAALHTTIMSFDDRITSELDRPSSSSIRTGTRAWNQRCGDTWQTLTTRCCPALRGRIKHTATTDLPRANRVVHHTRSVAGHISSSVL